VVSGCGQNLNSFAAQRRSHVAEAPSSAQDTAALIKHLQAAKELDDSGAIDAQVRPPRREDFVVQSAKADRAIRELQTGFAVPQSEIDDALEVPPRHLTPEHRAQLVKQLTEAKRLDEARAQEILIYWRDDEPVERSAFDLQAERAGEIAKDLQLGDSVHWADIQQALYVPADPL
jgi:hypothetical protein